MVPTSFSIAVRVKPAHVRRCSVATPVQLAAAPVHAIVALLPFWGAVRVRKAQESSQTREMCRSAGFWLTTV
jgi:hypothetical protein